MQSYIFNSKLLVIASLSLLSVACKVGPNFHSPNAPKVSRYTEIPLPKKTVQTKGSGGDAQTFVHNKDVPLLWWELFHSQAINRLIRQGLKHNPSLEAAQASLRQAQENLNVQIGNSMYPAIDGIASAQRQRYPTFTVGGNEGAVLFNLYNVAVNVSYTLDVFGGLRREIESLRAQVDYQQFEVMASYLTLTSNIVTTAVSIASYEAQIRATNDLIKIQNNVYNILLKQFELGGISNADVLTQKTLLEQTKATLPPLQKSLAQSKHAMAALIGTFPDRKMPDIDLSKLQLPPNLPVSLPSKLVRQRPDVRAAEALVHAACAQIGVATANLLPQFTITGSAGWIGAQSGGFSPEALVWNVMGQIAQPIFHGGALFAQRRAAIAAYQQAIAQYKQVVLQSFQNVADVLRAIETDARALQATIYAEDAAKKSLELTMDQYRLGGTTFLNLLTAQQQYQQTRISRIKAQATRYADTAALFQALGGGWWHKPWCVKECV